MAIILSLVLSSCPPIRQIATAQQSDGIPPDASHMPDIETEEPQLTKPEIPPLPTWGIDGAKLVPRLWPGNAGSPSKPNPTPVFEPEIQLPPEVDPTVLPDLYLADYFGTLPESYLVDPQTLLTAHERTSVNHALRQHFLEHKFPVYILLFEKEQHIPEFQDLEALRSRWFGDQPAVLIGFWLASPTRTSAFFGPTLRKEHGDRLDKAFADALGQSYTKSYPFSQLDHFTYTLLWRLAHLHETTDGPAGLKPGERALPTPPEFEPIDSTGWIPIAAGGSVLALGVAALGAGFIVTRRRRERKQNAPVPVVFPAAVRAERLGAPHSGGSGAVIKASEEGSEIPS